MSSLVSIESNASIYKPSSSAVSAETVSNSDISSDKSPASQQSNGLSQKEIESRMGTFNRLFTNTRPEACLEDKKHGAEFDPSEKVTVIFSKKDKFKSISEAMHHASEAFGTSLQCQHLKRTKSFRNLYRSIKLGAPIPKELAKAIRIEFDDFEKLQVIFITHNLNKLHFKPIFGTDLVHVSKKTSQTTKKNVPLNDNTYFIEQAIEQLLLDMNINKTYFQ